MVKKAEEIVEFRKAVIDVLDKYAPEWSSHNYGGLGEGQAAADAITRLAYKAEVKAKIKARFGPGTRVVINEKSGFSRGSKGTVQFHDPTDKVWVLRDGADSAAFFRANELTRLPDEPTVDIRNQPDNSRSC